MKLKCQTSDLISSPILVSIILFFTETSNSTSEISREFLKSPAAAAHRRKYFNPQEQVCVYCTDGLVHLADIVEVRMDEVRLHFPGTKQDKTFKLNSHLISVHCVSQARKQLLVTCMMYSLYLAFH